MVANFFLLIPHILLTSNWKYMSQLPVLFGYQGFYLDWWSMQSHQFHKQDITTWHLLLRETQLSIQIIYR